MKVLTWIVAFIGCAGLYLAGMGAILMWLWDWLLVGLFHWPVIDWWQGVGVALLLGIVGSFFRNTVSASKA